MKNSQENKLSNSNFTETNPTELYADSSDSEDESFFIVSHNSPRKISSPPSQYKKKSSGKSYLDREYQRLTKKIANDEQTIAELKAENKSLKEAISRAEETIKAYPQAQKNYDRLSASINHAHNYHDTTTKFKTWH